MHSITQPKLRVFAGPNGSGKTTLVKKLLSEKYFKQSNFINADEIEKEVKDTGFYDFNKFKIDPDFWDLQNYVEHKGISASKFHPLDLSNMFLKKSTGKVKFKK